MEKHSFGYWLKLRRKALDLTREEMAKQVGYSAATIRKIEDEERHPSTQVVERLAEFLKIPQNERTDFLRFGRGDLQALPGEIQEDTPWHNPAKSTRSNLPALFTSLIGRKQEIADVRKYLAKNDIRLVTLIGPPGIGKTRLSVEAARAALPDFADGVFFVTLAPLDDPSLIALTIAQGLGYVGARTISTSRQLKEGIGEKQILIILDNCEHLIDDVASLVAELLSSCSHLKILATSRESLRTSGEWQYPVPAFDIPRDDSSMDPDANFPGLALFAERARAVRPDFTLNHENVKTVSAICAHLDGLPLGIELIAARMRLMSPRALLERLDDQFILSADGLRPASERQKTLNHAIGWSYNLLSKEEKKIFAYLSVFSGGFTLGAAEKVFSEFVTSKPVSDLITSLLDKSLLQCNFAAPDETRYTMLMTIQEFARTRLRESGEETTMRNCHLAYFLDLAQQADQKLRGANQLEWLHRLEIVRDNLRVALDWAIETEQTEVALQLVRNLHWFWFVYGDHNEGRQWLERILAMPAAPMYPEAQAHALTQLAHHLYLLGHRFGPQNQELSLLGQVAGQGLSIARAQRDRHNMARALAMLGLALVERRDFTAAQSAFEESQVLHQDVHDEWGYAHAIMCLGWAFTTQDDLMGARSLYEKALIVFRKLGDRYFICVTVRQVAIIEMKQNDLLGAVSALPEALIAAQQLKSKYEIAATLAWWGEAEKHIGNSGRAVRLYWAAKNVFDSIGAWQAKDEHEFENDLAPCRAALSESDFAAAAEEGRAMTMEQAIQYALEPSKS
jgi:predicted ATPase/DNA-binding XRE family transcriptional regulator